MSRRFKASKYKNAAPKTMKHEAWVRDLNVGSYNCSSSYVKASAAFVAFNVNPTGSQLGVVALDSDGSSYSILNAHSDLVTDFDFSPFEDGLLATGSADSTVKVWRIDGDQLNDLSTLSPEVVTSSKHRRVENVAFHPTAEYLLSYSSQNSLNLWDVLYNKELLSDSDLHDDTIMSMSWSKAGSYLATCCKDKFVRVVDLRTRSENMAAKSHDNAKDSRVLWLGETPFILTTGFDSSRMRQIFIRDTRNFASPVKTLSFDSSTGILLPMFDPDTNMTFIAGRGDSSISYLEFSESDLYLTEGYRHNGEQTKGACLVPKRALRVMETEVNRVIQLTANSLIPIPYHVPRKSYIDFHCDLFPDTKGTLTSGAASTWMEGTNGIVSKISLNPASGDPSKRAKVFKSSLATRKAEEEAKISKVMDHDSELHKKSIPEPRPRKKSLSSSGSSSSDEVGDIVVGGGNNTGRFFPIPKPRVNTSGSGGAPVLRTPSSFISRIAADFSRSTSLEDSSDSPSRLGASHGEENGSASGNHPSHNINEGSVDEVHASNGNANLVDSSLNNINNNTTSETLVENGNDENEHEDSADGQRMSTSDRRKMFETRSISMQDGVSTAAGDTNANNGNGPTTPTRQPRLSVAERLKMFQQGSEEKPQQQSPKEQISLTQSTESHHQSSSSDTMGAGSGIGVLKREGSGISNGRENACPAPIPKPERKSLTKIEQPPQPSHAPQQKFEPVPASKAPVSNKRIDTVFGQVSKYRNFKAVAIHKRFHIENLRNISTTCPGESELIQANPERVAVPLNTPGGKLAIFELFKPGRQPDGVIPALVHGAKVMDFMWDPFDNRRLAVGCDDGRVAIWYIPTDGLKEQTNEPDVSIAAHAEKIYFVRFHPLAKDVVATGSYDLTIRIWDLSTQTEKILIHLHPSQIQILSFSWSPCGSKFAIACKDGKIRIYEPRVSSEAIVEGKGPSGVRGGRVVWVLDGKFIVMAGFDRSSERQVHMYHSKDLTSVASVSLDVSPSILVPFYDEDSSILLLTGRGDSTIFSFDVIEYSPYLRQLSQHRCAGAHQGISFLKKNACDVQNVEFARALRLTESAVEPWSFTVPRVKSEFFQDDLFPPTKVLWEPTIMADEWFDSTSIVEPMRVSLKPKNMKSVGEISSGHSKEKNGTDNSHSHKSTNGSNGVHKIESQPIVPGIGDPDGMKRQQQRLEDQLKSKLVFNSKLEQDCMEGVDEEEWNE